MKKEAELHAREDRKKQELIEAKNLADNLIYTTEKTLREAGENPNIVDIKKEIGEKIEALKKVKDSDNIEDIKNKTQELSQAIQKVGTELYKAAREKKEEKKKKEGEGNEKKKPEEGEYKEK